MLDDTSGNELEARPVGAVALVEISSNTISFSVSHLDDDLSKADFTLKHKARLGRYPDGTTQLNPEGREAALQQVKKWHDNFIDSTRYNAIAYVGTGAMRDADDAQDFVADLKREFGFDLQVISGKQEAYYAARAVDKPGITIDQGGRSCEFAITREDGRIAKKRSLPLGAFDILAQGDNAKTYIKEQLATLPSEYRKGLHKQLHVVGGGPREILKSFYKAGDGDDKHSAPASGLKQHAKAVWQAESDDLTDGFNIASDRAETAPANALLLQRIIKEFDVEEVHACKDGIREAILAELRMSAIDDQVQSLLVARTSEPAKLAR